MEAIQKRVSSFKGFLRDIRQANGIDREQLVLRSNHRHRSGDIPRIDKRLDRRANSRVAGLRRKSERRPEQEKSVDNTLLEQ
jgi:hypothetical protein